MILYFKSFMLITSGLGMKIPVNVSWKIEFIYTL